ncbi:unnamed protein product [Coffea canephora]|uniref:DH200=94 genomic scaffold, scaffold_271 n=1 Tax=Coffea canephora TaxID=49390 RepID=A0A068VD26_COFCA|nr:unnamed protein product [Coffea canephora]
MIFRANKLKGKKLCVLKPAILAETAFVAETVAMLAEFKLTLLHDYLEGLTESHVLSFAEIISFNKNNPDLESFCDFDGQDVLVTEASELGLVRKRTILMDIWLLFVLSMTTLGLSHNAEGSPFSFREATVHDIRIALDHNRLTSQDLVEFYLEEIRRLNPPGSVTGLAGIPILLKDNIATKDKLNTTAGSYVLLGSIVPQDAGVVKKLRKAGAIILGKASMTEWAAYRSNNVPNGWNARRGQSVNPYLKSADPCGSSTGSVTSVAANMAAVTLGTETSGSILCPSSSNSVVGIKPTVGLTSRAGVVPISPRQDTVGPICRTVSDAVYVLDAIVGFDPDDAVATKKASKYIPRGGYLQFLKSNGLKGKRLGIPRYTFVGFSNSSEELKAFEPHFHILRQRGAVLVDIVDTASFDTVIASMYNDQFKAMNVEFKLALNTYLKQLITSPVRSLADAIVFNKKHSKLVSKQ